MRPCGGAVAIAVTPCWRNAQSQCAAPQFNVNQFWPSFAAANPAASDDDSILIHWLGTMPFPLLIGQLRVRVRRDLQLLKVLQKLASQFIARRAFAYLSSCRDTGVHLVQLVSDSARRCTFAPRLSSDFGGNAARPLGAHDALCHRILRDVLAAPSSSAIVSLTAAM